MLRSLIGILAIAVCSCVFPRTSGDEAIEALLLYNWTRTTSQTKFAYVQNFSVAGGISMYTVNKNTGLLSQIGTLPAAPSPAGLVLDPLCRFGYLFVGTTLSSYLIDQNTGSLTLTGTVTSGVNPSGARVDASGRFLYFVSGAAGIVSAYSIDQQQGTLTLIGTQTTGAAAFGNPVIHPASTAVYVAGGASIFTFGIDSVTGAIAPLSTAVSGSATPGALSMGTGGRFLFHAYAGAVRVFTVGATGDLTMSGTSTGMPGPSGVITEHSSGRFGYLTTLGGAGTTVNAYTIDQITGLLTLSGTAGAGNNTGVIRVEPKGRFAYVSNLGSNDVHAYQIDPVTGALTLISSHASAPGVLLASIDPTGRFYYAPGSTGTVVSVFSINTDGSLSAVQSVSAGNNPVFAALANYQQWPAID